MRFATVIGALICASMGVFSSSIVCAQSLCPPGVVSIQADFCVNVGEEFDAEIRMTGLRGTGHRVVGGQFFLEYSDQLLEVVAVDPGALVPFQTLMFVALDLCFPGDPECTPELLKQMVTCCTKRERATLAVLIADPGDPGTDRDSLLATIRFRVISDASTPFIRFQRDADLRTTQLSSIMAAVPTAIQDSDPSEVDLRDFADFQNCYLGPGEEVPIECRCSQDFDADLDVDQADFEKLQSGFQGPGFSGCG